MVMWHCVADRRARARETAAAGCVLAALVAATSGLGVSPAAAAVQVRGLDVSSHQTAVSWADARSGGAQFAYIKATEGITITNTRFVSQYNGAYRVGLIRGAYHFARPNRSSGAAQARYFVAHGGRWSHDGRTLPGALDLEPNPHGLTCYGLSRSAVVAWIADFARTYHALTSRWPVIYTSRNWWSACTGGYTGFAAYDALWVARYAASPGLLPAGWSSYAFWQYATHGTFPGDQDTFNGSSAMLRALAAGR
jgi:GH25 family lysozyme M1 (1,4-beta-N-acetylmuramidase)